MGIAVPNLVEYNVSVCRVDGEILTSAIERPKHSSELLDFKEKYLSGANNGKVGKIPGQASVGLLSLTRDINPDLPQTMEHNIREWASRAFELVDGSGAPRVDFLCDAVSGEIWLNEINPCPGSFGYFLWEAAEHAIPFAKLVEQLIMEGFTLRDKARLPSDPTPEEARLFKRPS